MLVDRSSLSESCRRLRSGREGEWRRSKRSQSLSGGGRAACGCVREKGEEDERVKSFNN